MQEYAKPSRPLIRRGPFFEISLLVIFVVGGLLIGNLLGLGTASAVAGIDFNEIIGIVGGTSEHSKAQLALLIVQAVAALTGFVFAPLLYLFLVEQRTLGDLSPNRHFWLLPALLTIVLVIAFMPFNALLIEWNRSVDLPGFLDRWENWAKDKESMLEELTKRLTEFSSIPQLLGGLIVIALIPAVGEELVFRGLLQPKVHRLFGNVHAAVWITGFLFSFIHFQFYGLIPRMLLGVLFGYLYVWSGNLWYPILGHFINNGFTLMMYYLHQHKTVNLNIEDTAAVSWSTSLAFMVLSVFLLYSLKMYFDKNRVPAA